MQVVNTLSPTRYTPAYMMGPVNPRIGRSVVTSHSACTGQIRLVSTTWLARVACLLRRRVNIVLCGSVVPAFPPSVSVFVWASGSRGGADSQIGSDRRVSSGVVTAGFYIQLPVPRPVTSGHRAPHHCRVSIPNAHACDAIPATMDAGFPATHTTNTPTAMVYAFVFVGTARYNQTRTHGTVRTARTILEIRSPYSQP